MTSGPRRLLAKGSPRPESPRGAELLRGHTACVVAAAEELLTARGAASLRAARLPESSIGRLQRIVTLAAFVHDLGKCSAHFQAMVRGERREAQLLRHEACSLWLCWPGQPLAAWLRPAVETNLDYLMALVAAAGHHRKFPADAVATEGAGISLVLYVAHPDFADTLAMGARRLGLDVPSAFSHDLTIANTRDENPRRSLERWEDEWVEAAGVSGTQVDMLPIAKALVLAADVAGSALPRGGESLQWIGQQLTCRATREAREAIVEGRLQGQRLRPFQAAIAASGGPLTLVQAGCGTGKTIAAYQWAADHHATRQLWFTYPTTGTTTEGFRDYLDDVDDVTSRLEHGRAEVDLELFELHDATEEGRARDRLDAIRAWGCDVVACTVDTVLGLVQNNRKGLYAWPGLAASALVFDEIHAYDDQLFGALLRFLEALPGLPALLMTASLPVPRLRALRALAEHVHNAPLVEIPGPADLEALPRYVLDNSTEPWRAVEQCLAEGGKVLWVSNTVARCLALAEHPLPAGVSPSIYHSRFRYVDRVARHGELIEAFRRPGPVLALTTQVAEMSLDLSADLLITDLAPIPALIQRLGRLNRRSTPDHPIPPKRFVVRSVPHPPLPYTTAALDLAQRWLAALSGRPVSQRDLREAWEHLGADAVVPGGTPSRWLDGGFGTEPAPLREGSIGLTVLLPGDAMAVRQGQRRAIEVAVPMNRPPGPREAWRAWPVTQYYPVPPTELIAYDPQRGARWRRD